MLREHELEAYTATRTLFIPAQGITAPESTLALTVQSKVPSKVKKFLYSLSAHTR
jgi:hypothetical protein